MAIKLISAADGKSVEVWLSLEVDGHRTIDSEDGMRIGQGSSALVALSGAVAIMGEAVQDLANRMCLSAVEGEEETLRHVIRRD